jgi:hypothetical protein
LDQALSNALNECKSQYDYASDNLSAAEAERLVTAHMDLLKGFEIADSPEILNQVYFREEPALPEPAQESPGGSLTLKDINVFNALKQAVGRISEA